MGFNENQHSYQKFLETISEHRAPVVYWIGAGVSADADLPNWNDLRSYLAESALEEIVGRSKKEADEAEPRIDTASQTKDLWDAFEILHGILGEPTYKSIIREKLGPADGVELPILHELIWQQPATRGVVSLNIDGLEGRAHRKVRTNEDVRPIIGRDLKSYAHTFRELKPFIAQLHGHHADRSSWIFTKSELQAQIKSEAYRTTVQQLFSNFTVIFLGVSADDVAAGGFLTQMSDMGLDLGNHFWITNRTDRAAREWADRAGLLRVNYNVDEGETHTTIIKGLLEKSAEYTSKDVSLSPPVKFAGASDNRIPKLAMLKQMDEDDIRLHLNSYAKYVLDENDDQTDSISYQEFITNYSPAIHQSSHLTTQDRYNKFFGYTAVEQIHSGAFSSVWRVQDRDYNQFALKIMQLDNLRKGPQIESFRRGIASQRLMKEIADFDGSAEIKDAFEIPPSVIMEFVEGDNLASVSQKSGFDFWTEGLAILINLCNEVAQAHASKYGIRHRDIQPSNVMVPNYYFMESAADHGLDQHATKLLNYDMAWHKDAEGRVVPPNQASAGYYAPELLEEPDGKRAKDARIDSYGIGMTIFTLASGKPPSPSGSKSVDWESQLSEIRKLQNGWFAAAHIYLQRLVKMATQSNSQDRILVADCMVRLTTLQGAIKGDAAQADIEILAENLMYALCEENYDANVQGNSFSRDLDGHRSYKVEALNKTDVIKISFTNSQSPSADWKRIDKTWAQKLNEAKEILVSGGWKVLGNSAYGQRVLTLSAEAQKVDIAADYERKKDVLVRAIRRVQID